MSSRYPNLDDSQFPNVQGVNVYKARNEFDYALYDRTMMTITCMLVPWDLGEIHVGVRTIEKLGNVVKFESDDARDAWFKSQPDSGKHIWETKFRKFHDGMEIDIPLSVEEASTFNYLIVEYEPLPEDEIGQEFASSDGIVRWFYFIREFTQSRAGGTTAVVKRDTWQTIINHIEFPYMMVEQSHLGIAQTDVDTFLANPVENNDFLLADDDNFGEIGKVASQRALLFNDDTQWACIALTADPSGTWGTKYQDGWKTPAKSFYQIQGVPSYYVIAVRPSEVYQMLEILDVNIPQFKQAIQGIFFASNKLISRGTEHQISGVSWWEVDANQVSLDLIKLQSEMFGYDEKYAHLAKLYTYPYARLEIIDADGNVTDVKIQDIGNAVTVRATLSLAFPFINVDAFLTGIGTSATNSVIFRNFEAHQWTYGGKWYETLKGWQIPIFEVFQEESVNYDFATHFDRDQRQVALDNTYDSALASNQTNYQNSIDDAATSYTNDTATNQTTNTNAVASASNAYTNDVANINATHDNTVDSSNTTETNAGVSADTGVANTAIQTTANATITERSNSASVSDTTLASALNQGIQAWNAGYTRETTNNEVDAQYASAAVGAAAGAIGSIASGAMSGGAVGAVAGLVTGAISGAASMAQTGIAANLRSTQAEATVSNSQNQVTATNNNNVSRNGVQVSANTDNVDTTNQAAIGITANNAATQKQTAANSRSTEVANADRSQGVGVANAGRTQSTDNANAGRQLATSNANAGRTRDTSNNNTSRTKGTADANAGRSKATSESEIANSIKQAELGEVKTFGSASNGETAVTRPQAIFASVVTQPDDCIRQAGDNFLRFGYRMNRYHKFDTFNVMPKFSFWKCSDVAVRNLSLPDAYMDEVRFFLIGGVTIWRRPEDIGNVSIYENVD